MKIQVKLTGDEMIEILNDAIESGACGYWMESVVGIARSKDGLIVIALFQALDKEKVKQEFKVLPAHIQMGVDRLLDPKFKVSQHIRQSIITDNMDAETYDCILQAICFNEILYG